MSAQIAPAADPDNAIELGDGPGGRLREARQACGLQLEQAASRLHLHPSRIAALERDDYAALAGPVFVLGYIRNYARLLGLDPEPLVDAYRAANPDAQAPPPPARPAGARQAAGSHRWARLTSLAILVALGGLAFSLWQDRRPAEPWEARTAEEASAEMAMFTPPPSEARTDNASAPAASATEPVAEAPTADVPEAVSPAAESAAAPAQPAAEVTAPEQSVAEPGPEPEPAPAAASAAPEPASAGADEASREEATAAGEGEAAEDPAQPAEVVLSFSGPCWVDVRDSERKFKLFGEMGNGDRHVLEGTPPYSIILGNAAAVEVTVAGAPYDLSGVSRGNVARFTLDP